MRYGELTVFTGPMFADKTNSLVKEILFRTYFKSNDRCAVYQVGFDDRFEQGRLVSHDGLTVNATVIRASSDISPLGIRWAFFDEVQFFTSPNFDGDFIEAIRNLRRSGVDVFCAGLDMDYLGRAFEITASLMAEATKIERVTAECCLCGAPATHTSRSDESLARFEIGDEESYSPMCAAHWFADRQARVPETQK